MASILQNAAKVLGTAYDYATPGKGSSSLTNWGNYKETGASAPKPVSNPTPSNNSADSALAAELARQRGLVDSLNARTQQLLAALSAQPKLPTFDFASNYARAQSTAASTVNPVYQDKLNRYLEGKNMRISQETTTRTRNKEDIATELANTLEDIQGGKQAATEDTQLRLGDILANENSWQRQEGRQFDQARAALLGQISDAGLTESGIGQNADQQAIIDRNLASEDQTREFNNQRRDTTIAFNRKISELEKTGTRAEKSSARRTEDEDIALRNYIDNEGLQEREFRATNEQERLSAISQATDAAWAQIIAQTVQALAGSGARGQDIALFKQVYG